MAKNSTLADLDAFLKEQPEQEETTTFSSDEFVSQTPHQIVETPAEIEAPTKKKVSPKIKKAISEVAITENETPSEDSMVTKWADAINETVKGSEMLKSVPFVPEVVDRCAEQVKATEDFIQTTQNIWKKLWS